MAALELPRPATIETLASSPDRSVGNTLSTVYWTGDHLPRQCSFQKLLVSLFFFLTLFRTPAA